MTSYDQRDCGDWFIITLMPEDYDVLFTYKRPERYRDLKGSPANLTYYRETEDVAGMEFEVMKVVRIRRS